MEKSDARVHVGVNELLEPIIFTTKLLFKHISKYGDGVGG